jgi:hypothetical protein
VSKVFRHARRVNKSAINIEAQRDLDIIQRLFFEWSRSRSFSGLSFGCRRMTSLNQFDRLLLSCQLFIDRIQTRESVHMRAIILKHFGGFDSLAIENLLDPVPQPGSVLSR